MSAQRPDTPQLRPSNPFERRAAMAIAQAKPALSHGSLIGRSLPGGTVLEAARRLGSGRSSTPQAWDIRPDYSIVPGTIAGIMPTIGGIRLDASPPPKLTGIPSNGVRYIYAQLTFSTSFVNGYLSSFSLVSAPIIASSNSSPNNTVNVKHLHIGTITDGVPGNRLVTNSPVPVTLWDNGFESTTLRVGNL